MTTSSCICALIPTPRAEPIRQLQSAIAAPQRTIVLTSEDGMLAYFAAPEAAALWPNAEVRVLDGSDNEKYAREYLSWEVALVDQIKCEPSVRFRAYD